MRRNPLVALLLAVLLPACSSMQPATGPGDAERVRLYEERVDQLAGYQEWNMKGRLAVRSDNDGGSGNFSWVNNPADSRMDFHGALGRGAWTLEANELGAELELADGTVHRAATINQLVRLQVGWQIPVDKLSWWVRGLAAPGEFQERKIDGQGNLSELLQDGWTIEYGKYRLFAGISLPVRLTARQDQWKVKLAIRNWNLSDEKIMNE